MGFHDKILVEFLNQTEIGGSRYGLSLTEGL